MAIDIDHRVMKQQYTPLLPLNGIEGGRKTSCMACQKKKKKKKKFYKKIRKIGRGGQFFLQKE